MKWKLDEYLGRGVRDVFAEAGHDVATVREEGLQGHPDDDVFRICQAEQRCLVTLDLDFAEVLRFVPADAFGIVVLRPPATVTPTVLAMMARQVVALAERESVAGSLWVVEPGRIRVHLA